jgi:signal transduction histidine kinase
MNPAESSTRQAGSSRMGWLQALHPLLSRFSGLRLSTKAMLFNVSIIAIVISAVFVGLSIQIRNETRQLLQDLLNRSEAQVLSIQQDNLAQLFWATSQISSNSTLRAAMETYRLESAPTPDIREELLATIQNELDKIWGSLPHDLLFVTDEAGRVLGASGHTDALPHPGENLSTLPVMRQALDPTAQVGEQNFGVFTLQQQYYLVGSVPIELQGFIIGSLTLGDRIDSSFLPNLRAFFGGETLVMAGERNIASTLTAEVQQQGLTLDTLEQAVSQAEGTARIGPDDYLVTSMKLGSDDRGEPVTLYLLRSLTAALKQPNEQLKQTLATQALLAILLVSALTFVATRKSLRLLERFVEFMRSVAETGDYSRRFNQRTTDPGHARPPGPVALTADPAGPSNNELDLLINGFNTMLSVIETRDRSLKNAHANLEQGIRALHQKEQELRQAQKMEAIGMLAGGVAHEFNNILTIVSGFSELAMRNLEKGHATRSHIEEVQRACKSASILTRQLLALGRKQLFRPKVINLNHLIADLEKILRSVIGESLQLSTRLDGELFNVFADPAQIEQVLINLTLNSKDATEPAGTICIETSNADASQDPGAQDIAVLQQPHVVFSVTDSGCGMDKETQLRMFEPFFTTKEKGKGTGLGLSTVHGIIAQCGGHISVKSEPGKGTTIRVHLPRVTEAIETEVDSEVLITEAGTETILVVEDEPDVRKIVCKLLALSGYSILEAAGPLEALELLAKNNKPVDLLLTDVVMPDMNGKELYEQIALQDPNIKVLFMSGYTHGVIDEGGILPDGVNFLQKPFAPAVLSSKVRKILDAP